MLAVPSGIGGSLRALAQRVERDADGPLSGRWPGGQLIHKVLGHFKGEFTVATFRVICF